MLRLAVRAQGSERDAVGHFCVQPKIVCTPPHVVLAERVTGPQRVDVSEVGGG